MPFVFCQNCDTLDGELCAHCKKSPHLFFRGTPPRYSGDRQNPCWRALKRTHPRKIQCDKHSAIYAECDMCKVESGVVVVTSTWGSKYRTVPEGWTENRGLGGKTMLLCSGCTLTVDVGVDRAIEDGEGYSPTVCLAMAFAFQLGQYADSFPGSGGSRWDLIQRRMSPQFTVTTIGDLDQRTWTGLRFLSEHDDVGRALFGQHAGSVALDVPIIDEGD